MRIMEARKTIFFAAALGLCAHAATASLGLAQAQELQPPPFTIAPTTTDLTPEVATAVQAWRNQVSGLLMRAKRFPPEARKLQQEGSVRLRFSLDRTGAVTSSQIVAQFRLRVAR